MTTPKIEPHKITRPMQVIAVCIAGMIIMSVTFLVTAGKITEPNWASGVLIISGILVVPTFLVPILVLMTKYRTHMQDDHYYAAWIKRKEEFFQDFEPENVTRDRPNSAQSTQVGYLNNLRIKTYQENKGLFLLHS